jgi:hypothetical protein
MTSVTLDAEQSAEALAVHWHYFLPKQEPECQSIHDSCLSPHALMPDLLAFSYESDMLQTNTE